MADREWMIVSKPLRPPFRDGSTVLVRTIVESLPSDLALTYFGDPARPVRSGDGGEVIPAAAMGFSPGLLDKIRVLTALLHPRRRRIPLHFFFTPNRLTSTALAGVRALQPARPIVQSLMSSRGAERFASLLGSLDAVVVLSDHTRGRLVEAGLDPDRVRRIHPAVPAALVKDAREKRIVLYAGDLDAKVVGRLVAVARALARPALEAWTLEVAARPKAEDDAAHRAALRSALEAEIACGKVRLAGEVPDMEAVFERASLQLFAADHVDRKVDLPLVLLEGLARGVPLLVLDFAPVNEIFARARELGLAPGRVVRVDSAPEELAEAVAAVAADPALLAKWGEDAQKLACRAFSSESMVREYAALYEQLGERAAGRAS